MNKFKKWFDRLPLNYKFSSLILALMVVPIAILSGILFAVMEGNEVEAHKSNMDYDIDINESAMYSKIESLTMTTQFFLSDSLLVKTLNSEYLNKTQSIQEVVQFKEYTISSLERMVNSNPLLYGVRVYSQADKVQEIMPIVYNKERMTKQDWALKEDFYGWNFDYKDNIFTSYSVKQDDNILSLITPIENDRNQIIGIIEAAMTMKDMFPTLYSDIPNEISFYVTDNGDIIYGTDSQNVVDEFSQNIIVGKKTNNHKVEYIKTNHKKFVVSYLSVPTLGGTIVCVSDITSDIQHIYFMRNIFIAIMLALLTGMFFVVNGIVKNLLKQLYSILGTIRMVQAGNLEVTIENCGEDEMGELGRQLNTMLFEIRQLMKDNLDREMLIKNSEIRALQNQINAHFIYNVLESIKMMAEINEEYDISDAVTALGKLLRYSMKWTTNTVKIEQEMEYIKNYMALINLRYDYEIFLSVNIPDYIMKQEIPKMTLQPIVENAICHGIEEIAEDSNIYIKGRMEGSDCIIEITDPGRGMTELEVDQLEKKIAGKLDSNGGSGNGIGLKNVQDRIQIAFGPKYGISIASRKGLYTKIIVKIPVTHTGEKKNS